MKKIGINDFTFYNYPTGITASPDGKHAAIAVCLLYTSDAADD